MTNFPISISHLSAGHVAGVPSHEELLRRHGLGALGSHGDDDKCDIYVMLAAHNPAATCSTGRPCDGRRWRRRRCLRRSQSSLRYCTHVWEPREHCSPPHCSAHLSVSFVVSSCVLVCRLLRSCGKRKWLIISQ